MTTDRHADRDAIHYRRTCFFTPLLLLCFVRGLSEPGENSFVPVQFFFGFWGQNCNAMLRRTETRVDPGE